MDLDDFLGPQPCVVDLRAKDRWEAIVELVSHLAEAGKIKEAEVNGITSLVKKREASMSTGIDFGVALPHGVSDLVSKPLGIVGRSASGISFEAIDGKPVTLVLLFLVPQGDFQKHLHVLANIAKLMHNPISRERGRRSFD